jgi:hypothetical protein
MKFGRSGWNQLPVFQCSLSRDRAGVQLFLLSKKSSLRPRSKLGKVTRNEPNFGVIFFQALTPQLDSTVLERGEQVTTIDPIVPFSQLVEPNPENPICIIGLRPSTLVNGTPFRTPPELLKVLTPHNEKDMQFNITPKYSFVDVHIGESRVDICDGHLLTSRHRPGFA